MDFKKVTVGFFAAVMAMTSVCFADPETPVTTDVPATDPVPETTTTAQPQREDTKRLQLPQLRHGKPPHGELPHLIPMFRTLRLLRRQL